MKKILFTILLSVAIVASSFAGDLKKNGLQPGVNKNELTNAAAKDAFNGISKLLNPNDLEISENQLPVAGKKTFAKMFEGYTIKQTVRSVGREGEVYYFTLENEKEAIIVSINETLEVSVFKKLKGI